MNERLSRIPRRRRLMAVVALASAAAALTGACTNQPPGRPTPTWTQPTTPTTDGHGHTEHDHANMTTTTAGGGGGHDHGGGGGGHGDHELPPRLNHPPTAEQKAWAYEFVRATARNLQGMTIARAERMGYVDIGDRQHWTNGRLRNDGKNFDPTAIESLVFNRLTGEIEAAMYNLEPGVTVDNVPDYAGNWFVYHGHDDLCWNGNVPESDPRYWKLALCPPLGRGERREPVPMVHVWIKDTATARSCGVFASIAGLGPGSCFPQLLPSRILAGQEPL